MPNTPIPLYVPRAARVFPLMQGYVTFSERTLIYHFDGNKYFLQLPRRILQMYPLNVPFHLNYVVMVFSNSITINRLLLKDNVLENTTIYVLSTLVDNVQDFSVSIVNGVLRCLLLYNYSFLFAFETTPNVLRKENLLESETEYTASNKIKEDKTKGTTNQKPKESLKTSLRFLQKRFVCVASSKVEYIGNTEGVFIVSDTAELKVVSKEVPVKITAGSVVFGNQNAKDNLAIITKNAVIFGEVNETGLNEIARKALTKPVKSLCCGCFENTLLVACGFQDKTMLYKWKTTVAEEEYPNGKLTLAYSFSLNEDSLMLVVSGESVSGMYELQLQRDESIMLPLLPISDRTLNLAYEEQKKAEFTKKLVAYKENEKAKAAEYVKKSKEEFGEGLHQSVESLNSSLSLDERSEEDRLLNVQLEVPEIEQCYFDILSSYMKEYEQINQSLDEATKLVSGINELFGRFDDSMSQFNALQTVLQSI
ncbi:hypothetical protein EIN_052060 [Entamoeba invadens IP1]|uniref:hypothetical protein n=1 Tax=Entamoeba invadens IP1 TaxID=370355 RepID=UPI0002C3EDDC|nr:hypothetical protein EIN_052060 [Entamoeba invadens IP1]ELP93011.1 hypothetical protein EIN_052060 [Entamoeba invadens IP1]|eukprot:XP_004259782.1 hypothetical protein EIN_052060 [Entamoeba invadens IP1]